MNQDLPAAETAVPGSAFFTVKEEEEAACTRRSKSRLYSRWARARKHHQPASFTRYTEQRQRLQRALAQNVAINDDPPLPLLHALLPSRFDSPRWYILDFRFLVSMRKLFQPVRIDLRTDGRPE